MCNKNILTGFDVSTSMGVASTYVFVTVSRKFKTYTVLNLNYDRYQFNREVQFQESIFHYAHSMNLVLPSNFQSHTSNHTIDNLRSIHQPIK